AGRRRRSPAVARAAGRTRRRPASSARRTRRFGASAATGEREGEPRGGCRLLLVPLPRGTESTTEPGQLSLQGRVARPDVAGGLLEQLLLREAHHRHAERRARLGDRLTEQLTLGGVDERVRTEDLGQVVRDRSGRRHGCAHDAVPARFELGQGPPELPLGRRPGRLLHGAHELFGVLEVERPGGVVHGSREVVLAQLVPATGDDDGRLDAATEGDHRRPPGVLTEADAGALHCARQRTQSRHPESYVTSHPARPPIGNLRGVCNLVMNMATAQIDAPRTPTDTEALDAYSTVVPSVAERLLPSVVQLRVMRRDRRGREAGGAGSGVVITPDGFVLTSAHVLGKAKSGIATLSDGRELPFDVAGTDGLSDLGLVRGAGVPVRPRTGASARRGPRGRRARRRRASAVR